MCRVNQVNVVLSSLCFKHWDFCHTSWRRRKWDYLVEFEVQAINFCNVAMYVLTLIGHNVVHTCIMITPSEKQSSFFA